MPIPIKFGTKEIDDDNTMNLKEPLLIKTGRKQQSLNKKLRLIIS